MTNAAGTSEKRIQIVSVEREDYEKIAAAFQGFDLVYRRRIDELEVPAVMHGVSWQQYEALLDALPERYLRQAYYRGTLELRDKTMWQQHTKCLIDQFIGAAALEFEIRIASLGSTTRTKQALECGIEPDESYYFAQAHAVPWGRDIGPEDGPPPDLVVETDFDHAELDRLIVLRLLEVPEVWKYDGTRLTFHRLAANKQYELCDRSLWFPFLGPEDIQPFLEDLSTTDDNALTRAFLKHAKTRHRQASRN
ncbi:MAG TPA: Uma2 family endonuclease [Pirellulales bacterium]|nr:Uma2 family endonuclease [Pirellulales bacterium]